MGLIILLVVLALILGGVGLAVKTLGFLLWIGLILLVVCAVMYFVNGRSRL